MTNKRQIKKYIDRVGCDVAEIILPGAVLTKAITDEQAMEILNQLSELKINAHKRINIVFDKSPEAFDTPKAYATAKSRYFRQAYRHALKDYNEGVEKALAPINEARKKKS